jgi:P27 family predicted phage terminase small subunit
MRRISDKEKKVRGTYREDRSLRNASKAWNPYKELRAVPVPENLPEYALKVFLDTAAELVEQEVLTPLDLDMLQAYAYQCHLIREFQQKLNEEGYTIILTNVKGHSYPTKSPYVDMLNQATTLCNRLASGFGLNPVNRQRITQEPKVDDTPNPFDGF